MIGQTTTKILRMRQVLNIFSASPVTWLFRMWRRIFIFILYSTYMMKRVKTNIMNIISVLSHYPVVVQWKQISKTSTFHELMRTFSAFFDFSGKSFQNWLDYWSWRDPVEFLTSSSTMKQVFFKSVFLSWTCTCTLVTQYTVPPMVSHYSNYIQVDVTCGELQQCTRKGSKEEDCK